MTKEIKCKYCKEIFKPPNDKIKSCFKETCLSAFLEDNKTKIHNTTAKRQRELKTALKYELKSVSDVIKEVKVVFQKFIRLRDKGKPCISCGVISDKVHAGHYREATEYKGVIFDENNVHLQCAKCNRFKGGNEVNYRKGLVSRFGEQFVLELEQKAEETKHYQWVKDELMEIKKDYLKKNREFKN